ncbi:MAG TPA: enoyl-CoA hydratase-related protein [Myxococcota bacterium]|nr:enoyl-CoA hydratase-related protein [Myxococcota bacterium]
MSDAVRLSIEDGVATVTLNRPEAMNAWNGAMAAGLDAALRACDADDDVRAVVLTGAGRAFCAGADLGGGGDTFKPREGGAVAGTRAQAVMWPFMLHKPVVAAINGHAIGVGITLPLTCDIRFVAEDAKLQFAFVRRGVLPELASHTLLPRVIGFSRAADLLLTGRQLSGREAAELGLASRALPASEVLPVALAKAREFALAAPLAVAMSKRLLWEGIALDAPAMMAREGPPFAWLGAHPDTREGIAHFLEKRAPRWTGRPSKELPSD